jgi:hypothetical protein
MPREASASSASDEDVQTDRDRDQRVQDQPARQRDRADPDHHAHRGDHVGHQMARVRLEGDRVEAACRAPQRDRHTEIDRGGERGQRQTHSQRLQRMRGREPSGRRPDDRAGGPQDQDPFEAAREVLGFAVAEGVCRIGRTRGDQDHPQRERRPGEVDERLECVRQQADRAGEPPGARLEGDRRDGGRDRQPGEVPALQRVGDGRVG